jgi:hypothetical protein
VIFGTNSVIKNRLRLSSFCKMLLIILNFLDNYCFGTVYDVVLVGILNTVLSGALF